MFCFCFDLRESQTGTVVSIASGLTFCLLWDVCGEFEAIAKALDNGDQHGYWHTFFQELFAKNKNLKEQISNCSLLVSPYVRSIKDIFLDEDGKLKHSIDEICRDLDSQILNEDPRHLGKAENVDVCLNVTRKLFLFIVNFSCCQIDEEKLKKFVSYPKYEEETNRFVKRLIHYANALNKYFETGEPCGVEITSSSNSEEFDEVSFFLKL